MFFAPFGMKAPLTVSGDGIGLPSLLLGKPSVTTSSYFSLSWYIASPVEIVPSRSMTICLAWKELLSSASLQSSAPGGT
jgi:hypothetical protein